MRRRQWFLGRVAEVILHSPFLVLMLVAVVSGLCIHYASVLPYSTSRIDLIPTNHPARTRFLYLVEQFGPQNPVAVVVEGQDPAARRAFADRAAAILGRDPEFKGTIFYKIDMEPLLERGPFYVDVDSLELIQKDIESSEPMIQSLPDLAHALRAVNRRLEGTTNKGLDAIADIIPGCQRVEGLFRLMSRYLDGHPLEKRSWMTVLGGETITALQLFDDKGFLASRRGDMHFLLVTPDQQTEELDYLVPYVARIRRALAQAQGAAPVQASLTGIPISVLDEFESTERDLPRCTAASILGNFLILLIGFWFRPRMAILIMLALLAGIAWTMAFAKWALGYLNLISSVFVLFLLGMGINYGIYFATRFDLERRRGLGVETSMRKVIQQQGLGILSSALCGAVAFLTLCLNPFRGFQELGLIAGFGLLFCLIAGTFALPPLVLLTERWRAHDTGTKFGSTPFHFIVQAVQRYPLPIFLWFTFVTLYAAFVGDPFPFDYDLNRVLPEGSESLVAGEKLLSARTISPLSAIVICRNLEDLYAKERALRARPPVEMTLSWASFVPDQIAEKRRILAQVAARLQSGAPEKPLTSVVNMHMLGREIEELNSTLISGARSLDNLAYYPEARAATRACAEVQSFRDKLARMPPPEARVRIVSLGNALLSAWRDFIGQVAEWRDAPAPDGQLVPPQLRRMLRSQHGEYTVVVGPREDVNQKEAFGRFHAAVAEVDRDMTGYPVIIHTMIGLLPQVLEETTLKAIVLIAVLLCIDLRNFRRVLLAIFPVFIGSIWLMGLMRWLGLKYNPVNFLALPMILGVGIENGVNFVHGFREEDSAEALDTQGLGMLLSAGTSILGFEALALVSHRGLASFGLLLSIGTVACLLATIFYLPAVVELEANRGRLREQWTELLGHRFY